jgi:hypothetical protein
MEEEEKEEEEEEEGVSRSPVQMVVQLVGRANWQSLHPMPVLPAAVGSDLCSIPVVVVRQHSSWQLAGDASAGQADTVAAPSVSQTTTFPCARRPERVCKRMCV